ncbi:MAG: isoprenylcysteine carboxylmethyltransferase family protein [Dysgonamonadaceae bacterium]|jgi:protein-S-isoprenylcysteine O-methyltransferase Ste14|nr:isoprenylcysteine carboxylmethyltransferase family protein [Dysgonamonadaceae bacterium]
MRKIADYIVQFHLKDSSLARKIVSLSCGAMFFLLILPALFAVIYLAIKEIYFFGLNRGVEWIVAVLSLIFGLAMLIWTTVFQWKIGKGTPAPNVPTQKLIVSGPYRLCRNPIELGAIFYYLGVGTVFFGIMAGIVFFLLGLMIGSSYHKFVEEKELELRFGNEYTKYKETTPFLFPTFSNRNKYGK